MIEVGRYGTLPGTDLPVDVLLESFVNGVVVI